MSTQKADGVGASEAAEPSPAQGELDAAQRAMQLGLLRRVVALVTAGALGLLVRELIVGGSFVPALLGVALGMTVLAWSYSKRAPLPVIGVVFYCAFVALITRAALDMGGAAGSALSFAFLPGFLAVLTLGPALGHGVSALMLACFAWLYATTDLPTHDDLLRFVDEIAMTVFAAGLAHALHRGFIACKAAFEARQQLLVALRDQRDALTVAIYDELEPLSARLVLALDTSASHSGEREAPCSRSCSTRYVAPRYWVTATPPKNSPTKSPTSRSACEPCASGCAWRSRSRASFSCAICSQAPPMRQRS